jgi:hypothetical protein
MYVRTYVRVCTSHQYFLANEILANQLFYFFSFKKNIFYFKQMIIIKKIELKNIDNIIILLYYFSLIISYDIGSPIQKSGCRS